MNNEILSLSEVNTTVVPGSINCNISDLKAAVNAYAETYKVVQYSENVGEQMKQMKADRAKLNKLIEALNETRKDTKKKYLIPLDTYEQDIKELVNLVSEPCKLIDSGIKELERQRKEKEGRNYCLLSKTSCFTSRRFPGQTFIAYLQRKLGKYINNPKRI